ncbi:MAG: metallophosphoesterase [Clostridia bacterium]|nr:metallophosphoesterase [Clostridia bacterium]
MVSRREADDRLFRTIITVLTALLAVGSFYIVWRCRRFGFVKRLAGGRKWLEWLTASASLLPIAAFFLVNLYAVIIVWMHVIVFLALGDLIGFVIRKARKRPRGDLAGMISLCLVTVYLACGWFFAHHVFETRETFTTAKDLGAERIRVVEIADAHIGVTLDGEGFAKQMERVCAAEPDVVVLVGDFVDDDTERGDMLRACDALGEINAKYGVYMVLGNHDMGYFDYRNFSTDELFAALDANGVRVLRDEAVIIDSRFYLIGRRDRSERGRLSASELTDALDGTKYAIMLDHQPNDYDAEAESGVDLVLSGHTHGGHVFPAGLIGLWSGANDRTYGSERRGGTDFYVTSGISGWGIPFKTGCISEFVVIDIVNE